MADPSLAEYIAQAERGYMSNVFGPDWLQKQTYFTVDTATGIFTSTFGNKVWQALNNQTRIFNALPRTVWGKTAGWRVRTDRGSGRSRPLTEVGTLPTIDISNIETVSSLPRIVGTTFGASVKSIYTAQLEGGVGDILALEMENAQTDHVKEINEELLAGSAYLCSGGGTNTFDVPDGVAESFKIGDGVALNNAGTYENTDGNETVSTNPGTGTVTLTAGMSNTPANGDVAYIVSRAGITSIDDVAQEDLAGSATTGTGGSASEVGLYDITYSNRVSGSWSAAATVQYNSGVGREFTLQLLDNCIESIRTNGGEPKLIVMGHDQYFKLERLLNTQQRYMGTEEYQVGVGSEKTFPGTRTGMVLATYQGIPILPDADVSKSVATDDAVLGSNVFVLDTDDIEMAIAQPTQYIENRDYFSANALVVRGLFYTMGELRVKNIWTQASIRDLNA